MSKKEWNKHWIKHRAPIDVPGFGFIKEKRRRVKNVNSGVIIDNTYFF